MCLNCFSFRMEQTFVVTGGQKHIKKKKPFFLPEVFVENEEGMRSVTKRVDFHFVPMVWGEDNINQLTEELYK